MKFEDIQILKSFFIPDYRHDLIMNFLLNSFSVQEQ